MSLLASRSVANALAGPSKRSLLRVPPFPRPISTFPHLARIPRSTTLASVPLQPRSLLFPKPSALALAHPRYATSTATATSPAPTSTTAPLSTESSSESDAPDPEPEGQSAYARFKAMSKKYGWWAVGVYLLLSPIDFGIILFLIHTFGAERIEPVLAGAVRQYRLLRHGEEETAKLEKHDAEVKAETARQDAIEAKGPRKSGGWGSRTLWAEIGLAYAIHKTALLPVRAGLTVAITPKLVKWLAARGWVGKGGLTRAKDHAQGKIKDASQRVRERVRPAKE